MLSFRRSVAAAAVALLTAGAAQAGPYILAGTDADDHGNNTATANEEGWLFMQRALENIAASTALTTANRIVYALGSEGFALSAAQSAFQFSALASAGWTFQSVATLTNASLATALANAGIVMLDSGSNVTGGLTSAEETVLSANAAALNSFVGNGGGLFSQANSYGWLSTLVPGLNAVGYSDQGLVLTPSGQSAFPGLANADLSSGPWHNYFTNVGSIPVLANGVGPGNSQVAVIIGAAGGSITNPEPPVSAIPEPETYALMGAGLAALGFVSRRRKQQKAKTAAA